MRSFVLAAAISSLPLAGQESQLLTIQGDGTATAFVVSLEPRNDGLKLAFPGEPLALLRIGYGRPSWQPAHERWFAKGLRDRWFRLGRNYWATMDNNQPLAIGGVQVPAGLRYLGWGFGSDGKPALIAMDPSAAHARRAYPPFGDRYPKGIVIPLRHARADELVEQLTIELKRSGARQGMILELAWGTHRWSAPVRFATTEATTGAATGEAGETADPVAVVKEFVAALDTMDSKRLEPTLAPAVTMFFPHADAVDRIEGRANALAEMERRFAQWRDGGGRAPLGVAKAAADYRLQRMGDLAALVTWRVDRQPNPGRRSAALEHRNGTWRIVHFHSSNTRSR